MFKRLLLVTAMLAATTGFAAEKWKVTSLDWQPFSGKALPEGGAGIAVLRAALKAEGIELEVQFYPWTRAIDTAKDPSFAGFYPSWPEDVSASFTGRHPLLGSVSVSRSALSNAAHNFAQHRSVFGMQGKAHQNL